MNKIKIMLTAITVFAVVGGALAFKAKKQVTIYCSATQTYTTLAGEFLKSTFTADDNGTSYCEVAGPTTITLKVITDKD
jgi:ABC-type thiamine transport system substrate-binding protein